jgi:hypothetical protein
MKNPTSIALFESADPALRVARKLRAAGFDARVRGDARPGSGIPETVSTIESYRVVVPGIQTVRALSWCREFDAAEHMLSHAVHCLGCGSTRVLARLASPSESSPKETGKADLVFRCDACYFTWVSSVASAFADRPAAA